MKAEREKPKFIGYWLLLAFITIVAFAVDDHFSFFRVQGNSMMPTYHDREIVWILKDDVPARNEILLFRFPPAWNSVAPGEQDRQLVKRIVAVPGDYVELKNRQLWINDEKFLTLPADYDCFREREGVIPPGSVFVLGDNWPESVDSLRIACSGTEEYLVRWVYARTTGKVLLHF